MVEAAPGTSVQSPLPIATSEPAPPAAQTASGMLYVPDPATLPANVPVIGPPYSPDMRDRIVELFSEGLSLAAVCRQPEMPKYSVLCRWIQRHNDLRSQIKVAREMRALHFEGKAQDALEGEITKDEAPGARIKLDGFLRLAEINDPATYGKKTQITGDKDKPVHFVIHTGFTDAQEYPRLGPDGLVEKAAERLADKVVEVAVEDATDAAETTEGKSQSEHLEYLAEVHADGPVTLGDEP